MPGCVGRLQASMRGAPTATRRSDSRAGAAAAWAGCAWLAHARAAAPCQRRRGLRCGRRRTEGSGSGGAPAWRCPEEAAAPGRWAVCRDLAARLGRWPPGARPAERAATPDAGGEPTALDARPAQRPVGRSAAAEPPLAPFALAKPDLRAHWRCARALLHTWRRRARGGRVVRPAWPQTGCLPEVSSLSLARSSLHLFAALAAPPRRSGCTPRPSAVEPRCKARKGLGRASLLLRSRDKDRVRQDSVRREEVASDRKLSSAEGQLCAR
ncbi:hypothetical protein FA09DRAFT_104182 [Tilletiopsis washingtonensis]|uniref:Uncharacterized protein n=1 Tax=Tilletiopsis washingtonensis TaxID=58919 RepID=A0A316Z784_9BASI|nr:hypothetical protein FA09DRAFT_104182 [Tilletiopsis washingtonensis]PWN96033.1 hypothetical protein FA09DRAFT_104182 [Tilletiopsis washingtonensis]